MKKELFLYLWEAIAFGCIITIGRIYVLKNEPTYSILLQGLIGGVLWAVFMKKFVKFK